MDSFFYDKYVVDKELGHGAFGKVYKCFRADKVPYVVKLVPESRTKCRAVCEITNKMLPNEIALWRSLSHPNILQFVEYFHHDETWFMVMEYCGGYLDLFSYSNLRQRLIPLPFTAMIIKQVVQAALYCKSMNIDHRDIKDENILYNPSTHHVKLIDFGSADIIPEDGYTSRKGTEVYIPPEWYYFKKYYPSDAAVWSIGCLAYCLLNGEKPYKNIREIFGNRRLKWKKYVSGSAVKLVSKCLQYDPEVRAPLESLLESRWLQTVKAFH